MAEMTPDEFRKIVSEEANKAASAANTDIMEQTVVKVLTRFGIENPKKMNRLIVYAEDCMRNKQDMRRGFFSSLGGNLVVILIAIASSAGVSWAVLNSAATAAVKGLGG